MLCSLCRQDNRVWHHLVHLSWNDVLLVLRRGRKRIKHQRGKKKQQQLEKRKQKFEQKYMCPFVRDDGVHSTTLAL